MMKFIFALGLFITIPIHAQQFSACVTPRTSKIIATAGIMRDTLLVRAISPATIPPLLEENYTYTSIQEFTSTTKNSKVYAQSPVIGFEPTCNALQYSLVPNPATNICNKYYMGYDVDFPQPVPEIYVEMWVKWDSAFATQRPVSDSANASCWQATPEFTSQSEPWFLYRNLYLREERGWPAVTFQGSDRSGRWPPSPAFNPTTLEEPNPGPTLVSRAVAKQPPWASPQANLTWYWNESGVVLMMGRVDNVSGAFGLTLGTGWPWSLRADNGHPCYFTYSDEPVPSGVIKQTDEDGRHHCGYGILSNEYANRNGVGPQTLRDAGDSRYTNTFSTKLMRFDGKWHRYRFWFKAANGVHPNGSSTALWIDDEHLGTITGRDTAADKLIGLSIGRFMWQQPIRSQFIQIGRLRAWTTNPGWNLCEAFCQ